MNRRRTMFGAAAAIGAYALAGRLPAVWLGSAHAASPSRATPRLSMAEYVPYRQDAPEKIQRRFDLYTQLGFGTLRTNIAWRHLETSEGNWREPEYLKNYIGQAIRNGFRLKIAPETLGGPPAWYLDAHPDARIRNATNEYSKNDLSLWYPDLRALLAEKTDRLFSHLVQLGVFQATDFLFVDLGPASEPIYPAAWTMGKSGCRGSTPWFYDSYAQAAFAQTMSAKYGSLAHANRAWGTNFSTWADVRTPLPGQYPGVLWDDALTWYRDSKRSFIRWQVANYQRAVNRYAPPGAHPHLIIFVSGRHIPPDEWRQAVTSAMPDCQLSIMSDSEFLMELAKETGCWLQYPAVENDDEAHYLRQYMKSHGITEPIWGENVGVEPVARDPDHLADVVLAEDFYGLDYVRSSLLFGADGVTPNETFAALARACQRLRRAWG